MALELNPEIERQVLELAQAAGTTANDYVAGLLQAADPTASPDPATRVRELLHQWQQYDRTPTASPAPNDGALTPSEALFRQWEREDATLSAMSVPDRERNENRAGGILEMWLEKRSFTLRCAEPER
ncbi:MAG TPA: hypothetical protein VNL71_20470 [Chloroflexota bacterium]|nr:hypothetical protein [Chloroflexota bacterium]